MQSLLFTSKKVQAHAEMKASVAYVTAGINSCQSDDT